MTIQVKMFEHEDIPEMRRIWNEIIDEGNSFPQDEKLTYNDAEIFFKSQSYCGVAKEDSKIYGLYILHPNNIGRCSHIANASYAVSKNSRNKKIGEKLVKDSMVQAKKHSFGILQFNAVVKDNIPARKLYEKLGFIQLGTIKNGFRLKNDEYIDICPYYIEL